MAVFQLTRLTVAGQPILDNQFLSLRFHEQTNDSLFLLSIMPACDAVSATMSLVKPNLGLAMTAAVLCKATVTE